MQNKILLLINTGTPAKPETKYVRRYLSEFLNDKRVIDLPWLLRKILVNVIIVPFRAPKSTRLYQKLWTAKGSPLLYNLNNLVLKIQNRVKNDYLVYGAMRYGEPSLYEILKKIKSQPPEQLIVFPLYPHYASSTTGSVNELILNEIKKWNVIPEIRFIGQFYSHPAFIDTIVNNIKRCDISGFDHVLFSYHSLPLRHIQKIHMETDCISCECHLKFPLYGTFCYKATCYETTRLISEKLNLSSENHSTSFQSRFSKNWLNPFTDESLKNLAQQGKKRILIVAPSFVADCLETLIEIKHEYLNLFKGQGGDEIVLVESLNDTDEWADALIKIAQP
jgi:ferrochelatase